MSGPRAQRAIERVLARIEEQPAHTFRDEALKRLAFLTVFHAGHGSQDPFARAYLQLREAWHFELDCEHLPLPASIEARPTLRSVDGRDGEQWTISSLAYLRWRQGLEWRRTADRREPVVDERARAIHLLTQIQNGKHDAGRLDLFLSLKAPESAQLLLHFPAPRPKAKRAAA